MNFIKGNQNPIVGKKFYYEVVDLGMSVNFSTPDTLQYVWYIYKQSKNGNWENIAKTGGKTGAKVPYKFGEIAVGIPYKLEVFKVLKNKFTSEFEAKLFGN